MRIRLFFAALCFCLIFALGAAADTLLITYAPDVVYPGKAERITLQTDFDCTLTLEVLFADGATARVIRQDVALPAGAFTTTFNGMTAEGLALPQGEYTLRARAGGQEATAAFAIGAAAPQIYYAKIEAAEAGKALNLTLELNASMDGALSALLVSPSGAAQALLNGAPVSTGSGKVTIPAVRILEDGAYTVALTLTSGEMSSNAYQLSLPLRVPATPTPIPTATPRPTPKPQPTLRPSALADSTAAGDYWSMELGNYDWDAIWQVMIAPMTVIRGSGKTAEKQTYKLRAEPTIPAANSDGNVVGLITCETQGVHVLETREDSWTYVEVYNSSYGEAYRKAGKGAGFGMTDERICGYVETSRLDTFTPRTEYGLLIDKKTQELYIVTEKGLLSTLLISTGKPSKSQPWNETPAGEYYLSSKVGDFPSGNLTCCYGMRFNNGDILHQVPYILNEKYNLMDYSSTEKYLGQKASHGCVRVQRKLNDDGINMKWIYDNVPLKTKLLIWDDDGRPDPFMEYPIPLDATLYYNPNGGQYYHADQNCASIKNRYLPLQGSMTYAELDDPAYQKLTPCKHCDPPALRPSEVDALNAANGY